MSELSIEKSLPLHLWRRYIQARGFGKPIPDHVLRYLDLVALALLDLPSARTSERQKGSDRVWRANKVPPKKDDLKASLLRALQFDPPTSKGIHEFAKHERLGLVMLVIETERSYAGRNDLMSIDAAISEAFGVDMDQAANLRAEAEQHERTYLAERADLAAIEAWLERRENPIVRKAISSHQK